MSYITPGEVATTFWRWFWIGVGTLVLAGALTLAMWQAGWWFTAHNATRQAEVIQNGYSNQSTLRSQVTAKLADVTQITVQVAAAKNDPSEVSALEDQRAAIAGIVCSDAAQITGTPLPADQAGWVSANCSDGGLSPGSDLYVTGAP